MAEFENFAMTISIDCVAGHVEVFDSKLQYSDGDAAFE